MIKKKKYKISDQTIFIMLSFPRNDIVVKIKFSLVKVQKKKMKKNFDGLFYFYDAEFIQYAKANRLCNIIIIFIDKQRYNKHIRTSTR